VNRRKAKQRKRVTFTKRKERIKKLLAAGWISSEAEIPADAIPVDPEKINLGGSYFRPTFFQAVQFACADCGIEQTWKAEDQRWYYETTGAPYYSLAKRCRGCRKKERARKQRARVSAGHANKDATQSMPDA
jgi:hypothetical protein